MSEEKKREQSTLNVAPGVEDVSSLNPSPGRPATSRAHPSAEAYVEGLLAGDRMLLSRAITLVESTRPAHQQLAQQIIEGCLPYTGHSIRIGISGAPGVGKSTFIEAFGLLLLEQGRSLAVLTVDPSSERTKGSILGDKTRMETLSTKAKAFIRPSPTGGSLGGVARRTRETILLCEAAGFDTVLIETVGVGQSEITVHSMVDFFLVLVLAGAGDELQGIKRGIIEMADTLVITKADGTNRQHAFEARGEYRNALSLYPPPSSGWRPQVVTCSARTGEGLPALWDIINDYETWGKQSGNFEQRRQEQARKWMYQTIEQLLQDHFLAHPGVRRALQDLERAVLAGKRSSVGAAQHLLDLYRGLNEP